MEEKEQQSSTVSDATVLRTANDILTCYKTAFEELGK